MHATLNPESALYRDRRRARRTLSRAVLLRSQLEPSPFSPHRPMQMDHLEVKPIADL
jgi:hypothetical protein